MLLKYVHDDVHNFTTYRAEYLCEGGVTSVLKRVRARFSNGTRAVDLLVWPIMPQLPSRMVMCNLFFRSDFFPHSPAVRSVNFRSQISGITAYILFSNLTGVVQ